MLRLKLRIIFLLIPPVTTNDFVLHSCFYFMLASHTSCWLLPEVDKNVGKRVMTYGEWGCRLCLLLSLVGYVGQ